MIRRRSPLVISALCLAASAIVPCDADAQAVPTQPLDGTLWQPSLSLDPDSMPHVEGTRLPGAANWNVAIALQFLERPYAYHDSATGSLRPLVAQQLWTNYLLQFGLFSSVSLGLDLPVLLGQSSDLSVIGQPSAGAVGFGDVRAVARWSSRAQVSAAHGHAPNAPANRSADNTFVNEGPGLSVLLAVTAPTGDPHALTGAGAWTVHPQVVADFRLFGLLGAVQVGYHARLDRYWPAQSGHCSLDPEVVPSVSCLGTIPLHDAITWSAGLRIPSGLLKGIASPYVEVFGAFDARTPGAAGTTPIELGGGVQRTFGEITATLGATGGLTDAPGNPRVRVMALLHWAPRFIDEDNDGLRDNTGEDQCVGLPEDFDGYQDNDGCPEDNDTDDIPDAEDRCPNVNEDVDGFQDEDGCPDPDNDNDGVLDTEDQCPNVAMGPHPDERRPGCPNDDSDGDGVHNADDQCPDEAAGSTPDPARPGCPSPDSDHDGVPDSADACPHEAAPAGAPADQLGCPDLDRDHDGVLDEHDRCPDQPETINGFQDEDGCPEPHPPASARSRVRVVHRAPNDLGSVELLESVVFTANDEVAPASVPTLSQLALALVATSRRPQRWHTLTVATTPASVHGAGAIDAQRAARRRDAVLVVLRAHGAPEWAVRAAPPIATPARPDRGIVLATAEIVSHESSASPAPSSGAPPAASASPAPASGRPASSAAPVPTSRPRGHAAGARVPAATRPRH